MAELLIIADDFTGALDSGVYFAAAGARIRVITGTDCEFSPREDAQVLVMNADTRHLPPRQAYETVYRVVLRARAAGIPFIYKKTDSALRGNIGIELAAAMDAAGEENLVFAPAFPGMNRLTINGAQLIGGIPVSESVFGKDPFDPVVTSHVKDIIGMQTDKPVVLHTTAEDDGLLTPAIHVYDAASDEDLRRIGQTLGVSKLRLAAGCAGFAAVLAELLDLKGAPQACASLPEDFFIVCGSMNPVTIRQLDHAEEKGFPRVRLTPRQKLDPQWPDSREGQAALKEWIERAKSSRTFILDVNGLPDESGKEFSDACETSDSKIRGQIADNLGQVIKRLLDNGLDATLMCTGGDTIQALMKAIGVTELTPIRELVTGVVLAQFQYNGKTYYAISKSGGFGKPDLMSTLASLIAG